MENRDWYDRRGELREGMTFRLHDGSVVRLDRRVPGDGTNWYVADRYPDGHFSYEDATIHPSDLESRINA